MKNLVLACAAAIGLSSMMLLNVSEKDREFVREAADAGMLEVKLGELAQKNGVSAEVKKLGSHMVTDHTKANKELQAIADKKGVAVSKSLSEKHQKKYDELAMKKGKDFDKAYSDAMVDDHEKVINLFERQAKDGDDADLKAFAAKTKPTLEHHLHMSKETCETLKKNK